MTVTWEELQTFSPSEWMTVAEVARLTRFSVWVVYRAIRSGELTAYKLHGRLRIRRSDVETWFADRRVEPAARAGAPRQRSRPDPRGLRILLPSRDTDD